MLNRVLIESFVIVTYQHLCDVNRLYGCMSTLYNKQCSS